MKLLFNNRNLLMFYDKQKNVYVITYPSGVKKEIYNALEAWSCYNDKLDSIVRKDIGNMFVKQGLNRYTGKPDIKFTEE